MTKYNISALYTQKNTTAFEVKWHSFYFFTLSTHRDKHFVCNLQCCLLCLIAFSSIVANSNAKGMLKMLISCFVLPSPFSKCCILVKSVLSQNAFLWNSKHCALFVHCNQVHIALLPPFPKRFGGS